jgi:predicted phosphodiesterase
VAVDALARRGAPAHPAAVLPLLLALVFGVRTLPDGDGWAVRFEGDATATVDGVPQPAGNVVRFDGARAHEVVVGDVRFTVPPRRKDRCAPLRLVAMGDSRAGVDGVGPSAYFAPILAEALARGPDAVLHTGDIVKNGRRLDEWHHLLRAWPYWPPVLAVRGNHDRGEHFEGLGLAPGPVWGVDLGPVFVAGIDTEVPKVEPLAAELDRVLAEAAGIPFKIVVMHRPTWSNGQHGSDDRRFNHALVPVFDRHGVDLVLAGHDHNYERFCPSRGTGATRRCADDGTVYVTTGGASPYTAPVRGPARDADPAERALDEASTRAFSGAQHFVEIEIGGGRLTGTAHATRTGNLRPPHVIDTFTIERPVCR